MQLSAGPEEVRDVRLLGAGVTEGCGLHDVDAGNALRASVRADGALEC